MTRDSKNAAALPPRDSYNRSIDYLRISITDRCNLECVYCNPKKKGEYFRRTDLLTFGEITRFVEIACRNGLKKVRITGGEPLLRRDLSRLISALKNSGVQDLSITTNGILFGEHARVLKDSGLDRVNISLDTLDSGRYSHITNGGNISRVWDAIEAAERAGLSPVKINVVPMRGYNDDEILSFASLTLRKDYHVRFIEFMPVGCNTAWSRDRCVRAAEVLDTVSSLGPLERFEFKGKGPSRNFRLRGAAGVIGIISPMSDHFCGYCNRLRITADGRVRPCLFSKEEVDFRTPMRNGADDGEIEALIYRAIRIKPQRHVLDQDVSSSDFLKAMSKIGG